MDQITYVILSKIGAPLYTTHEYEDALVMRKKLGGIVIDVPINDIRIAEVIAKLVVHDLFFPEPEYLH